MLARDKLHELITAAVQRVTIAGAEVAHDVKVGGRQFDVLVRLQTGMHRLLLAFEVKDHKRPTSVETVDAFVTKARDVAADKAIIVSTSGFQKGALEAGKRHSIDLFKLSVEPDGMPRMKPEGTYLVKGAPGARRNFQPDMRVVEKDRPTNAVRKLRVVYEVGPEIDLPDESSQMMHCLATSRIRHLSLGDIVHDHLTEIVPIGKTKEIRIPVSGYLDTFDLMFLRRGRVTELVATVEGDKADVLDGNFRIELTSVDRQVTYENVLTREKYETTLSSLPLGGDDLEAGRFYFLLNPLRYHFCDSINGRLASLIIVESFQLGEFIQSGFTQDIRHSQFYLPVEDKAIIKRLELRLQRYRSQNVMVV